MTMQLTNQLLRQFNDEGYVILQGVIDQDAVAEARNALSGVVDDIAVGLRALDHVTDLFEHEPFETRLLKLFEFAPDLAPSQLRRNLHLQGMHGLFFNPRVLDLVEQIIGSEIRLYPNYTVRPKLPDDPKTLVLWHQDGAYTQEQLKRAGKPADDVDALRMVNVWSPLVPARVANGCMQFIPRTHTLGVVPHNEKKYYLEIDDSELKPRLKDVVDVETDPGDVVLFSNLLFHCGQPNRTPTVRWSCDWRYQDARQPTLRDEQGHLARSRTRPDDVVRDADDWASRSFT